MAYDETAAIERIGKMTKLDEIETVMKNAMARGYANTAQSAKARYDEIKSLMASTVSYGVPHAVGDHVVQYSTVRGREWKVNVSKDGKYLTEAPVTWSTDRTGDVQKLHFVKKADAWQYAKLSSFWVAVRKGDGAHMGPFVELLDVTPISSPEPVLREKDGRTHFNFTARVNGVVAHN